MQRFGQYEVQSLIGRGGMGEVYLAHDSRRDRDVALKLLPEALAKDPTYEHRFRRESYAAARLSEPHVIPIHDYGEVDGRLFIDMRLVDGQSLAALLSEEGALAPERAVALVGQMAEALDAAHKNGLVHRDVKPANILVTPSDFVYVADFGIAHSIGQTRATATSNGAGVGTMDYMAPERFTNGSITPRTDVYSLACVLFECLTGSKPFLGADFPSLVYAHVYREPPRPSEVEHGVPPELDAVVSRGLAKDPEARFAGAGDLAQAAKEALRTAQPVTVATPTAMAPATPPSRPGPLSAPVAAASGVDGTSMPATARVTSPPSVTPVAATQAVAAPDQSGRTVTLPANPANGTVQDPAAGYPSTTGPARTVDGGQPPASPPPAPPTGGASDGARPRWSLSKPRTLTTVLIAITAVLAIVATVSLVRLFDDQSSVGGPTPFPLTGEDGPRAVATSVARPTVGPTVQVGSTPGYMEIAPSGEFAYIANRAAGVLTVFDTTRNVPTGLIPVPDGGPQFVAFSPDGARAYVSIFNQDFSVNEVGVLDTSTGTFIARVPTGKRPFALDVSPDGRKVYVPNHDSGSLTVIDTATNTVTNTLTLAPNPHWVDFSPDGTRLYAANHESNVITTVDTSNDAVLGTVAVGKSPHSIIRHTTRPLVFNANYDDSTVSVTDVDADRVVATVPTASHPQDITLSADGKHAYLATVDANIIQVLDTTTYAIVGEVQTGRGPTSIAVTPDGRQGYATNLLDGSVTVINLAGTA